MLKHEIKEIVEAYPKSEFYPFKDKELCAIVAYRISQLPYFKKNYNHFNLFKDKNNDITFGHVNNRTHFNQIEIDFDLVENKSGIFIDKQIYLLPKKQRNFVFNFLDVLKTADSLNEVLNFIEESKIEDFNEITRLFGRTRNTNNFLLMIKNWLNKDPNYLLNNVKENFKIPCLEDFFNINNKEKFIELAKENLSFSEITSLFVDSENYLFNQQTQHQSPRNKEKILKKLMNNEHTYNNSLIKIFLDKKPPNDKILQLYEKLFFKSQKELFDRNLLKVSKNIYKNTLEEELEGSEEVVEFCIDKLVKRYPYFLTEKPTQCDFIYLDKESGEDSYYEFVGNYFKSENCVFYTEIGRICSNLGSLFSESNKESGHVNANIYNEFTDEEKISLIKIKDGYETQAWIVMKFEELKENNFMINYKNITFNVSEKYREDEKFMLMMFKKTIDFLKKKKDCVFDEEEIIENFCKMSKNIKKSDFEIASQIVKKPVFKG